MVKTAIFERLKQICEEMMQMDDQRVFGQHLKHEFMDFINSNTVLRDEYCRRAEYYENLPGTDEFKDLINAIHTAFIAISKEIDESKLPAVGKYINQAPKIPEENVSLSLIDINKMLASPSLLPDFDKLNTTVGVYVGGGITPPWDSSLRQYELLRPFIFDVEKLGALPNKGSLHKLIENTFNNIKELRQCITAPMIRWHLDAFYDLKFYGRNPEFISLPNNLKKSVERVTKQLLHHLQMLEDQEGENKLGRGRRATVKYKGDGMLEYKGDEHKMPKNTNYSILSEKVYEHCQQVGSKVASKALYEAMRGKPYETDRITNWKWLYQTARSANRWSKREGLPPLFECTNEGVKRLV